MRGGYYLRQAIQKAGGTIAHEYFSYCRASYVQLVVKPVDDHFDYTPLPQIQQNLSLFLYFL